MYKIAIADKAGFLRFDVEGHQDRQTDADIDRDIAGECAKREATAALIDIRRLTDRLSIVENHEAAKTFRQRMPLSLRKIAIVDLSEHAARIDIYETTARNWGARIRFFECVADAERWLRSISDDDSLT